MLRKYRCDVSELRRDAASMGPQLYSCGNREDALTVRATSGLQWGRSADSCGKVVSRIEIDLDRIALMGPQHYAEDFKQGAMFEKAADTHAADGTLLKIPLC